MAILVSEIHFVDFDRIFPIVILENVGPDKIYAYASYP
jgi:hypothetical protein